MWPMTLREAAAQLGISADTLRAQIRKGRLDATKLGRDWLVEGAEVARYQRNSLGRPGRPPRSVGTSEPRDRNARR